MCLNVGGRKHWVMSKHFVHFPGTRLGRLTRAKTVKGDFQLLDLIITELKRHMTVKNSRSLIGGNFIYQKKILYKICSPV